MRLDDAFDAIELAVTLLCVALFMPRSRFDLREFKARQRQRAAWNYWLYAAVFVPLLIGTGMSVLV